MQEPQPPEEIAFADAPRSPAMNPKDPDFVLFVLQGELPTLYIDPKTKMPDKKRIAEVEEKLRTIRKYYVMLEKNMGAALLRFTKITIAGSLKIDPRTAQELPLVQLADQVVLQSLKDKAIRGFLIAHRDGVAEAYDSVVPEALSKAIADGIKAGSVPVSAEKQLADAFKATKAAMEAKEKEKNK